jgi:ketosteroid isomerase-like protein
MSESNIEVVKRFQAAMVDMFHTGEAGYEKVLQYLDPDVVFRVGPSLPYGGTHVGHDGFLKMARGVGKAWQYPELGHVELQYFDADDDHIVVVASYDVESRQTGRTTRVQIVEIITLRDGRISELVPYYWDTVSIVDATDGVKTV